MPYPYDALFQNRRGHILLGAAPDIHLHRIVLKLIVVSFIVVDIEPANVEVTPKVQIFAVPIPSWVWP
jgi:hypothetical protein